MLKRAGERRRFVPITFQVCSNCALATASVGAFPLVTMPALGFT
jgi:hypothetical protein